jgi:hypothetical protein
VNDETYSYERFEESGAALGAWLVASDFVAAFDWLPRFLLELGQHWLN